jgi:hypothetical protein
LLADMRSSGELAAAIRAAVGGGGDGLACVGEAAQRLALGWGEAAYATKLGELLHPHVRGQECSHAIGGKGWAETQV